MQNIFPHFTPNFDHLSGDTEVSRKAKT